MKERVDDSIITFIVYACIFVLGYIFSAKLLVEPQGEMWARIVCNTTTGCMFGSIGIVLNLDGKVKRILYKLSYKGKH